MARRPDVIQRTLLQNPMFQNSLPDTVIYNTLELATAWVEGYADLFLFQRVSPSGQTYGEIRDGFNLGRSSTSSGVSAQPLSSSFGCPGPRSSGAAGFFGAIGTRRPLPTSQGVSSSSPSYPSSGYGNRYLTASPDSFSNQYEQLHVHPSEGESWDDIQDELDRVYEICSRLNGQSDSDDGTPTENHEIYESDDSGVNNEPPVLPWRRMDEHPL